MTVTAEHQKAARVVDEQFAQRVDLFRVQVLRRECSGVEAARAAIEARMADVLQIDDLRSGVDDEALAFVGVGDGGIAERMAILVTVFAFELLKLIPAGLLIGEVDAPLNIDQRTRCLLYT